MLSFYSTPAQFDNSCSAAISPARSAQNTDFANHNDVFQSITARENPDDEALSFEELRYQECNRNNFLFPKLFGQSPNFQDEGDLSDPSQYPLFRTAENDSSANFEQPVNEDRDFFHSPTLWDPQPAAQPSQPTFPTAQPSQPSFPIAQPIQPTFPTAQPIQPTFPTAQPSQPSFSTAQPTSTTIIQPQFKISTIRDSNAFGSLPQDLSEEYPPPPSQLPRPLPPRYRPPRQYSRPRNDQLQYSQPRPQMRDPRLFVPYSRIKKLIIEDVDS